MKILFVTREYPPSRRLGGIAYYVQTVARALADRGHAVHVLCASDTWTHAFAENDGSVRVHRMAFADFVVGGSLVSKSLNVVARQLLYLNYRKRLSRKINEINHENSIDLVEFSEYGAEGVFWLQTHKRDSLLSPAVVTRLHGSTLLDRTNGGLVADPNKRAWDEVNSINASDLVTSPSCALKAWANNLSEILLDPVVVPNFIDYGYWSAAAKVPRRSTSRQLFYAGTISRGKGCFELVDAIRTMRGKYPDLELVLAGRGGRDFELLQKQNKDGFDQGWLSYAGIADRPALREHYRESFACIFPSHWEPFGLVCAEAMAAGALVMASAHGGMSEIVTDASDGLLFEPTADGIRSAIDRVMSLQDEQRLVLRSNAVESVGRSFGMDAVVPRLERLYASLCNVERGSPVSK